MKTVRVNTGYLPQCALGGTENHFGVPFTSVDSGEVDGAGNTIAILCAELEDGEADAMLEVGRVVLIEKSKPAKDEKLKDDKK